MSVSIRHHRVIWTPVRRLILLLIGRSAHRVLAERTLHMANGRRIRWLRPEIVSYVGAVGEDVKALRPISRTLYELSFGNRLMVELAMYTIAGYRQLLGLGSSRPTRKRQWPISAGMCIVSFSDLPLLPPS
jgi:hypothetical protein